MPWHINALMARDKSPRRANYAYPELIGWKIYSSEKERFIYIFSLFFTI